MHKAYHLNVNVEDSKSSDSSEDELRAVVKTYETTEDFYYTNGDGDSEVEFLDESLFAGKPDWIDIASQAV